MGVRNAPLTSMWTNVAGWRVHARATRQPPAREWPPVVLVHGLTVSSRYMVRLMPRLAAAYPVFAPDLPGFGRSDKPQRVLSIPELADTLIGWMDAAGIPRAVLAGQSMGCQIIADAAVRYPERVVAAALIGPAVDCRGRTPLEQARRLAIDALLSPPSAVVIMLRDFVDCGAIRTLRTLHYALSDRIEEKLPLMHTPTLIIRGERDQIAPQRWVAELHERLPDGELALVPGAPHATQYAAPAETAGLVSAFLARRGIAAPAG
jgi:2-hydroxy-6-oxonona-2,4-dienedioate hydrolase